MDSHVHSKISKGDRNQTRIYLNIRIVARGARGVAVG